MIYKKMNKITENTTRCALCNSSDTEIVCTKAGMRTEDDKNIVNVICLKCGLIYNSPIPSEEELKHYYLDGGYVANRVMNDGGYGKMVELQNKKILITERVMADVVYFLKPFLWQGLNIVDIGCSVGNLGAAIKKQLSVYVVGVEPDALFARAAREYNHLDKVEQVLFDEYVHTHNKEKFDMVIMRHVFEHLRDPNDSLKKLKSLLTDVGYLFLVVPNVAHLKVTGSLAMQLQYGHLYHYTPYTLQLLLLKHGMKVVRWRYGHNHSLQVVATRIENPVNSANIFSMAHGSTVPLLKLKFKLHNSRHFLYRVSRKTKHLLGLNEFTRSIKY